MNMHVMLIKHVHMEQAAIEARGVFVRGRMAPRGTQRPTHRPGEGLRRKLSLDQDPSAPTVQTGPGWGTQMHAVRPPVSDRWDN